MECSSSLVFVETRNLIFVTLLTFVQRILKMAAIGYALAYNRVDIDIDPHDRIEGVAAGPISPGMLCTMDGAGKWVKNSLAVGPAELMVAGVDSLRGRDLTETVYANGDRVFLHNPQRGDKFLALIKDGQNVLKGDKLVSNGDGTFKKVVAITDFVFAIADDDLNLTAAGANAHVV